MIRFLSLVVILCLTQAASAQQAERSFQQGLLALQSDDARQAIDHFTNAVADQPKHAKAWYYRGVSRDVIGDHTGAVHDLDRALLLDPNNANALLRRAEVHLRARKFKLASADIETLLSTHPSGPIAEHALFTKGEIGIASGDHMTAKLAYDRLITLAPHDAHAWYDRGIALSHLGQHVAAVADLSQAIELMPTLEKAYGSRAVELIYLERTEEACLDLAKARELGDVTVDELLMIYCY